MTRNDWLWLAVKVIGLWLVVQGVLALPTVLLTLFTWPGFWAVTTALLSAALPFLFGVFLIRAGYEMLADEKKA